MKIDVPSVRRLLKEFDFRTLFREQLGWDNYQARLDIPLDGTTYTLMAIAEKRGFQVYTCATIPDRPTRLKLDRQVTKSAREHLIIYTDAARKEQLWEWVRREPDKPAASRDYRFNAGQSGDALIQKLEALAIALDEEEKLTIVDVTGKVKAALDVDKITKRFYDRFKAEHAVFMKFIKGIKHDPDLQWYTSLMLNRLMFVYFIQKKGFLDGDVDYLRNRLARMRQQHGKDKFYSFYRYFLLRLFHEGLGQPVSERDRKLHELLGDVPFLDGGFFEVHELEERYPDIDIPDTAFEKLFHFFDAYRWHLDERPLRSDNEINPDVVGYIFEKYINQKQMGAYYTKEDITEYISKNTVIPFLFDAAEKKCAIAFKPDCALWRLLRDDPDRYIYPAVRHGVIREDGSVVAEGELPDFVQKGMHDPQARMHDKRFNLQQAPAGDPIRLVTETWREHVARRQRCLEIREKLRRGDVHQINDLVTLNLDIWQFARDAIVNSEGPELLRAFYHTIAGRIPMRSNEKYERGLSVLDPTCGSGAFLFAALRILETLYADCLERMRRFVDDLQHPPLAGGDRGGVKHRPEKYADFKAVLDDAKKHPNERYFVLKSIIINNLFGVDIMAEAVEICKLRLFLKLVAQVETADQIEPLPDIDFNIRAGNTLVGYVSLDEVRRSQAGTLGFGDAEIKRIEEDALIADGAYKRFRETQVRHGGAITAKDKAELRERLGKLDAQLDRYLAGEYGVKIEKPKDFDAWKASHQPFHWLVEFFGIMRDGGFDVIIGNPPYVQYKDVKSTYVVRGLRTLDCDDLYAFVMERSIAILNRRGAIGMIVPVSLPSTDGFAPLRALLLNSAPMMWLLNFAERPSKLFTGVEKRLSIVLARPGVGTPQVHTSKYRRWFADERDVLFAQTAFVHMCDSAFLLGNVIPKISETIEHRIFEKLRGYAPLTADLKSRSQHVIYYTRKVRYFVQFFSFVPRITDAAGRVVAPSELKELFVGSDAERDIAIAVLNSNLFFWFFCAFSDVRNVNRREIEAFPVSLASVPAPLTRKLQPAAKALMADFQKHSRRLTSDYGKHGTLTIQSFQPRKSKPVIDTIDALLASHFGLTASERDFLINHDFKYRMGGSNDDGDDE